MSKDDNWCDECKAIFAEYNRFCDQGDMPAAVEQLERYDRHADEWHRQGKMRHGKRRSSLTKKDKQVGREGIARARAVLAFKAAS